MLLLGAEAHHLLHAATVVPRAVEQHHLAGRGQLLHVALKVPALLLALRRRRQSHDPGHSRIQQLRNPLDDAALAGSVAALKDDDDLEPPGLDPLLGDAQISKTKQKDKPVFRTWTFTSSSCSSARMRSYCSLRTLYVLSLCPSTKRSPPGDSTPTAVCAAYSCSFCSRALMLLLLSLLICGRQSWENSGGQARNKTAQSDALRRLICTQSTKRPTLSLDSLQKRAINE